MVDQSRVTRLSLTTMLAVVLALLSPQDSRADESGVSFWLPGTYGSLASVPVEPGLSFATIYYHTSVSASLSSALMRGGAVQAGLKSTGDLVLIAPSYTFATPVLGGQFAISMMTLAGPINTSISATLTGRGGNSISGARNDSLSAVGDLSPSASLKWNQGSHNFMVYMTGNIPVGAYSPNRLSNIGLGHGAVDGGAGYTYFDTEKGHEVSATAGFTYNLINPQTRVQSGVDFHLDWGASQFLSKQFFVGAVGYFYNQVSCDSGSRNTAGCFKSRIAGVGPQVGFILPVGEGLQGFLSVKGYKEFAAQNRPSGWNAWVTLSFSAAAKASPKTVISKN